MSEYEYEKVEGLKGWQILKLHEEGVPLYTGKSSALKLECIKNIKLVVSAMNAGSLYTRKEKPWWEGCEGSIVMVRDSDSEEWVPCIFEGFHYSTNSFMASGDIPWTQARPLTTAERDKIKVQD